MADLFPPSHDADDVPGRYGESAEDRAARKAREAEVNALEARRLDPDDPYDAHHGTDRSEDSLEYARQHDPETYERVMGKIARGE